MKAWIIERLEGIEKARLTEVADPVPAAGEVVLRLTRAALNPAGRYLAFLGRISPEKRPDVAIHVARRARIPLKLAAKVDAVDTVYFETVVKPLLDDPGVEFVGEIGDERK